MISEPQRPSGETEADRVSAQVRVPIDDRPFDFLLTLARNGEFRAARALVYDLPEAAQQLVLGPNRAELDRKLRAHRGLFAYIVPLVLAGRLPAYRDALAAVRDRLLAEGSWQPPATVERQSLEDNILNSYEDDVELTIQNKDNGLTPKALMRVAFTHHRRSTELLLRVLPFLSFEKKRTVYRSFHHRPERVKDFLVEQLNDPASAPHTQEILAALAALETPDDGVYAALLEFYRRPTEQSPRDLGELAEALRHYPTEEVKAIWLELLGYPDIFPAETSAKLLLQHFQCPEEVAERLVPHLATGDAAKVAAIFAVLCHPQMEHVLPSAELLFDAFERATQRATEIHLVHEMAKLTRWPAVVRQHERVYSLLRHERASVRAGALIIAEQVIEAARSREYLTPRFIDRYRQLAGEESVVVAKPAVRVLGRVGARLPEPGNIVTIVKAIEAQEHDQSFRLIGMQAINRILPYTPYPPRIEEVYLAALKDPNAALRREALRGLRYSPDKSLKSGLLRYLNDPDPDVRRAARNLGMDKKLWMIAGPVRVFLNILVRINIWLTLTVRLNFLLYHALLWTRYLLPRVRNFLHKIP